MSVLNLPKATELNKMLPKKAIYAKFQMSPTAKAKFDADISRINIVGEISSNTTGIAQGQTVSSIFVLQVILKQKNFQQNTIAQISKLIDQNMLLILEYEGQQKLAIYHTKLIQTDWVPADACTIELKGLDLDSVWENFITQVGGITIQQGNTLDQQIAVDEKKAKLDKEIAKLEKQAKAEKQPKKKFELVQQINILKKELKPE
jgi:hypothetical protein